jgi:hypothetical protein
METDGFGQHVEDHRAWSLVGPRDVPVDGEALGATRVYEVKPPFVFQEIVPVDVFERKHVTSVSRDDVFGRMAVKMLLDNIRIVYSRSLGRDASATRPP